MEEKWSFCVELKGEWYARSVDALVVCLGDLSGHICRQFEVKLGMHQGSVLSSFLHLLKSVIGTSLAGNVNGILERQCSRN